GALLGCRYERYSDAAAPRFSAHAANLGLVRVSRLVRRQVADVAGPYLAARCARRGADRGVRNPGRHPPEARRLRLSALFAADVPPGLGRVRAADLCALDR